MIKKINIFLLIFFLACACSIKDIDQEVSGHYKFSIGNTSQQITIRSDGTYQNSYYFANTLVWSYQEYWSHDEIGKEKGISFYEFKFGIPEYSFNPGRWFVTPEKSFFGVTELCFDPDLDYCFRKD